MSSTKDDRSRLKGVFNYTLSASNLSLCLGLFSGKTLVGWSTGFNIDQFDFCVDYTYINSKHRNRGLYQPLITSMIHCARKEGFQTITSNNHCSLSRLISKKLKIGFYITGLELDSKNGALIKLDYLINKKRLDFLKFRVGELRNSKSLKRLASNL